MIRRGMSDPVSWLLVLVAVVISAVAVSLVATTASAAACGADDRLVLTTLCSGGPDQLWVAVSLLVACASWCLVGMRAARLPR